MDLKSIICGMTYLEVYIELKNIQNHKNCRIAFTLAKDATHVAHWGNSRKIAFTEPSRGMSGAKVEQTSAETLSFRCVCERCRFTRGDVGSKRRKLAFTLAEVLITLGIIGVVVAMTLPTLIANYQKQVYVNQLKRTVSVLDNGFKLIPSIEGVGEFKDTQLANMIKETDKTTEGLVSSDDFFNLVDSEFKKAFKVTKSYKNSEVKALNPVGSSVSVSKDTCKNYIGKSFNIAYKLKKEECVSDTAGIVFQLADGAYFDFEPWTKGETWLQPQSESIAAEIKFDTNGFKGPNVAGYDYFAFLLFYNGKLAPAGGKDWENAIYSGYYMMGFDCNPQTGGYSSLGCANRIIENGWKIDY